MNSEQINNLLDKLGNAINAKGSQAFSIYVKQKYMTGVTDIMIGIILLLICGYAIYKCAYYLQHEHDEEDNTNTIIGIALLIIVSVIIFDGLFLTGIKELINPSYYALQDIISSVTGN